MIVTVVTFEERIGMRERLAIEFHNIDYVQVLPALTWKGGEPNIERWVDEAIEYSKKKGTW